MLCEPHGRICYFLPGRKRNEKEIKTCHLENQQEIVGEGDRQWPDTLAISFPASSSSQIITLNVNGLNSPPKRQRWAKWVKKKMWSNCAAYQRLTWAPKTSRLKVKGWRRYSMQVTATHGAAMLIMRQTLYGSMHLWIDNYKHGHQTWDCEYRWSKYWQRREKQSYNTWRSREPPAKEMEGSHGHHRPTGPTSCVQNTPPNSRTCVFPKHTHDILQERPCVRPQTNSS